MANQIYIPYLNPVQLVELDKEQLPQYMSRNMDEYWFSQQQEPYHTQAKYYQKWSTKDAIKLQFESNFASIYVLLVDCNGGAYLAFPATQKRINKFIPGYYVYEATLSLDGLPDGIYFMMLELGGGNKKMISEPIEVKSNHPYTLLFEYNHSRELGDVIFQTGINFSFRVEAVIRNFDPGNERTAYRDQRLNPTVLNSIPYRSWDLFVGFIAGVPDWVVNIMNWIFSCDNVRIDGKAYGVADGAKWEAQEIDPTYLMRGHTLKIQEGFNRSSKIVGVEVDINKRLLVGVAVDSTIFGDTAEPGSNLITITDFE
jgi:hypothetical protein